VGKISESFIKACNKILNLKQLFWTWIQFFEALSIFDCRMHMDMVLTKSKIEFKYVQNQIQSATKLSQSFFPSPITITHNNNQQFLNEWDIFFSYFKQIFSLCLFTSVRDWNHKKVNRCVRHASGAFAYEKISYSEEVRYTFFGLDWNSQWQRERKHTHR
jgi:hypothetical protein